MIISVKSENTPVYQKEKWSEIGIHNYIKIIIIGCLFFYVFYREINSVVYSWITDSSWSHGFLIPLFSLYFINQRKKEIINLHTKPNYLGLLFLIASIFIYIFNIVLFYYLFLEISLCLNDLHTQGVKFNLKPYLE